MGSLTSRKTGFFMGGEIVFIGNDITNGKNYIPPQRKRWQRNVLPAAVKIEYPGPHS
jgi:hypothetical protein